MKYTYQFRRVDDLGRIVIPKPIRDTLNIKEGDPLTFSIEGSNLILQKYKADEAFSYLDKVIEILKQDENPRNDFITILTAISLSLKNPN